MLLRAGFEAKGRARHGVVMRHIDGRRVVVPLHPELDRLLSRLFRRNCPYWSQEKRRFACGQGQSLLHVEHLDSDYLSFPIKIDNIVEAGSV